MAPVKQYWGAAAIAERIGLSRKSKSHIQRYIRDQGLLCYKRRMPGRINRVLYASEPMIERWEVAKGLLHREQAIEARNGGYDKRYKALDRKRKGMGT